MLKNKKILLLIFCIIVIITANIFTGIFLRNRSKEYIMSSYENYGELPPDMKKTVSQKNYKKLARRIKLDTDSRTDLSSGKKVYGINYTENYSFDIDSVYGFCCFFAVNYKDSYMPINSDGDYYPDSYGNRPCTIYWKFSLNGWKICGVYDVS